MWSEIGTVLPTVDNLVPRRPLHRFHKRNVNVGISVDKTQTQRADALGVSRGLSRCAGGIFYARNGVLSMGVKWQKPLLTLRLFARARDRDTHCKLRRDPREIRFRHGRSSSDGHELPVRFHTLRRSLLREP
jgi:hypothetical protein